MTKQVVKDGNGRTLDKIGCVNIVEKDEKAEKILLKYGKYD